MLGRTDEQIGNAVAVLIADARHVLAESLTKLGAGQLEQRFVVSPSDDNGSARLRRASRRSDHIFGAPIAVDVLRAGDRPSKLLAGLPHMFDSECARPPGIHINSAAPSAVERRRRGEVDDSVAVEIADRARDPSKLISRRLRDEIVQNRPLLREGARQVEAVRLVSFPARIFRKRTQVGVMDEKMKIIEPSKARFLEPLERCVGVPKQRVGAGCVVARHRSRRRKAGGLLVQRERLLVLPLGVERVAEEVVRLRVLRLRLEDCSESGRGAGVVAGLELPLGIRHRRRL